MTRPRPSVAEVIRSCVDAFLEKCGAKLVSEQRRALEDLTACRTAALGGHVLECPQCGQRQIAYNSCGNRHCPACRATAAARWLEARAADLLTVPYFHLVFTLPNVLGPLARSNPRIVYDLLLRSAALAVLDVAANPDRLGARTGVLAVLHTWGQTMQFHPHVHCVVPGGGLALDRTSWVGSGSKFFLPVRVLSRVFRGKFLSGLRAAHAAGRFARCRLVRRSGHGRHSLRAASLGRHAYGLGRLLQASLCRPGGGAQVSGAVQPPGGDQQQPLARVREWDRPLSLQGLRSRQQAASHEAARAGVRAASDAARAATGLGPNSPLRAVIQSPPA